MIFEVTKDSTLVHEETTKPVEEAKNIEGHNGCLLS